MARLVFGSRQSLVDLVAPGLKVTDKPIENDVNFGLGFSIEVEGPGLGPDDEVVAVVYRDTTLEGPVYSFSWKKW